MTRIIDEIETKIWVRDHGLLLDSAGNLSFSGYEEVASFSIPGDSGAKTALAHRVTELFEGETEVLLWIDEYGIWPNAEDRNLFEGFRKSLGETSPLWEKPGHLFSKDDGDTMISFLAMVFYFVWGAVLVSTEKHLILRISHDEFLAVYAADKEVVIQEVLLQFKCYLQKADNL